MVTLPYCISPIISLPNKLYVIVTEGHGFAFVHFIEFERWTQLGRNNVRFFT